MTMQTDSNFKFKVSLSDEAFTDKTISGAMIGSTKNADNRAIRKKYGFRANRGIGFRATETTPQALLDDLLRGRVFCHLFEPTTARNDGSFSSSQKCNMNFRGSWVIGVDIDHTSYSCAESYIEKLRLKPTFFYTSYSNMQKNEDGTSKGARFRLIYVFDELILNPFFFRFCAWQLNRMIEEDTGELITDDCNLRCSQYFNGTCKDNDSVILSYGITNNIYSLSDINVDGDSYKDFLIGYAGYKTVRTEITSVINSILNSLDFNLYEWNKKEKKFEVISTNKTEYFEQRQYSINNDNIVSYKIEECEQEQLITSSINVETEKQGQFNNLIDLTEIVQSSMFSSTVQTILNDFDRLEEEEFKKCSEWEELRKRTKYVYRVEKDWINNTYQFVDDDYFSMFYYNTTKHDGEKRRKTLYQRMCLRRIIEPSITEDEMVVNTIIDIMRFFDNSDGVLGSDFIKRNIESCFNQSIEDIEEQFAEQIAYLRATTKPKRGIIYYNKEAHSKETTYLILDELYDSSISVTENLEYINNVLNYKVGKTTIYEYLSERDIKKVNNKITDEELYNLLDVNLSIRKNQQFLKDNDINVGKERINKILNNKKNNIISINQDNNCYVSSSINDKTEEQGQSILNENELLNVNFTEEDINARIEAINVESFVDTYNGIEEIADMMQKSFSSIKFEVITPNFFNMVNAIRINSPFLADMAEAKMEEIRR